jgi:CRP-like cAMP-binding protein
VSVPDKLWYLGRLNLFEGMSVEEVERISRDLRMRSCSAKSSVLDGSSERVYVIKQGRVRLYHVTENGRHSRAGVLARGDGKDDWSNTGIGFAHAG